MHALALLVILTALWALAPLFGSPASLWVMPLVALAAAWGSASARAAALSAVGALATLVLLWSSVTMLDTGDPMALLGAGVAIFASHAPIVALLAWGAGRGVARWRRRGAMGA